MAENFDLEDIQNIFTRMVADETGSNQSDLNLDDTFHSHGLDSVSGIFVMEKLEKEFNILLTPLDFWDYPTIRLFSEHIRVILHEK